MILECARRTSTFRFFTFSIREQANRPSLRASSDHRFIVGALRARRMAGSPFSTSLLGEWPRLPSTARIGRAQFHRARSASKEGTWPPPLHPSEAARCARTEDHQAPSPPLFREHRTNVGVIPILIIAGALRAQRPCQLLATPLARLCTPFPLQVRADCRRLVQQLGHWTAEEMRSQGDCEDCSMFRSAKRRMNKFRS